jgi:hypothetical protein
LKSVIQKIPFLLTAIVTVMLSIASVSAQETMVVGQVVNAADRTPIPQVNITFKNTNIVVQSNEEGYFIIKNKGKQTSLVFSCVGFKLQEINVKYGQSVGMDIKMEEESTLLQEVFIIPGANPALELIKKVRMMRKANDVSLLNGFSAESTEQNLVLLSKINQRSLSKRIFDQLKKGNLSKTDSSLVLPMYMAETKFSLTPKEKREVSKNIYSSSESGMKILEKLVGNLETELNFYENSVSVFGKGMVSPLANVGYSYYNYYLTDSIQHATGKQYEIHFRSKNIKNLAFNGKLWIDSATFALVNIEAELPNQANINFIHNLRISENFIQQPSHRWTRQTEEMALNMNYELMADSLHPKPEIFVKRTASYHYTDSNPALTARNFAKSSYTVESLDDKLKDLNNTPILRTAKWIADVMFTGYMDLGKIDLGKVEQIIRITDIEGVRLTLPLRTNEKLWKNVSLGGYAGYGFKNQTVKYSGFAQFKLPREKRRILGVSYTNDYRRVDYNYNDFLFRENPLILGDEDISSSVFALKSVGKMGERKEFSVSFTNEWNSDIESSLFIRSNEMLANASMPMEQNGTTFNSLLQQSVTLATRFSFGERKYNDHMQRIYIANAKPVIYGIMEYGKYQFGDQSGNYGKISTTVRQYYKFGIGQLNYILDAGMIFGNVPYQLLQVPPGSETGGYSTFQFNMMNYMEYAADKYINLHSELMLNGLIMNQIPLIKKLNLREMCSFNIAYGGLNNSHKLQMDYPTYMSPMDKPYVEAGVGLTNILGIFTLQSVWRLTDLNHVGMDGKKVAPWGLRGCLSLSF